MARPADTSIRDLSTTSAPILRSITEAARPPRIGLALLAIMALMAGGRLIDLLTPNDLVIPVAATADGVTALPPFAATIELIQGGFVTFVGSVIGFDPAGAVAALGVLFYEIPALLWTTAPVTAIAFALLLIVVCGFFGGAIARTATCEQAGHERVSARAAIGFTLGLWRRCLSVLLIGPAILAGLALIAWLCGLLLSVPWLNIIGGALYGIVLVIGLLAAIATLGTTIGWPLLLPAVATENCDALDAIQRATAYVIGRPLRYAGSVLVGVVGLTVGYLGAATIALITLALTAAAAGPPEAFAIFDLDPMTTAAAERSADESIMTGLVQFWRGLVACLVAAWAISYLFSASTALYLGMRQACDGQHPDEVWQPGLVPGTLAPMPEPVVETGGDDTPDDSAAGRSMTATPVRA